MTTAFHSEESGEVQEKPRSSIQTFMVHCFDLGHNTRFKEAAAALRAGELVAFPTETVYGLGANAFDEAAVRRIYQVKGRPQDNPLIVHLAKLKQLPLVARDIPELAYRLYEHFAPGPLTLILKRQINVPALVSAGLDTVAVRFPAHPVARELIAAAGVPLVAPSANLSGKPSPTTAEDCLEDLAGLVPYIVDGGSSEIGVESTVLDLCSESPRILRPGAVTEEMLSDFLGIELSSYRLAKHEAPKAPGMKYRHYAPEAELRLISGEDAEDLSEAIAKALQEQEDEKRGSRVGLWIPAALNLNLAQYDLRLLLRSYESLEQAAQGLFTVLRDFDRQDCDLILAAEETDQGLGCAYMNRLRKAAGDQS